MKLNTLSQATDAIETLMRLTGNEGDEIFRETVDSLIGVLWDEEDAGEMKAFNYEQSIPSV